MESLGFLYLVSQTLVRSVSHGVCDVPRFQVRRDAVVDFGILPVEGREGDVAAGEAGGSRGNVPRRAGPVRQRHDGAGRRGGGGHVHRRAGPVRQRHDGAGGRGGGGYVHRRAGPVRQWHDGAGRRGGGRRCDRRAAAAAAATLARSTALYARSTVPQDQPPCVWDAHVVQFLVGAVLGAVLGVDLGADLGADLGTVLQTIDRVH